MTLNWGDVPTWVGSVSTGAALLIAAVAYRRSVHDGEREQASHVTAWVVAEEGPDGEDVLHVKNSSNAAIYSVVAYYQRRRSETTVSPYYEADKTKDAAMARLEGWASLGPGSEGIAEYKRDFLLDPAIPWLYFRDANGIDWIRDYRARLKRSKYRAMQALSESYYMGKLPVRWKVMMLPMTFRQECGLLYQRMRKALRRKDSA